VVTLAVVKIVVVEKLPLAVATAGETLVLALATDRLAVVKTDLKPLLARIYAALKSKVPSPGADETAFLTVDVRYGEAFPTDTSFDTSLDRENIAKTSAMPHEALLRVTSLGGLGGDEGRGCSKYEGIDQGEDLLDRDKSVDKGSDSTDEMPHVLGTLGAAYILASRGLRSVFTTASLSVASASTNVSPAVATASGSFSTTAIFTTASEQQSKEPKELSEEELKKMIELVPVKELYIKALHMKYPIIDWKSILKARESVGKLYELGIILNTTEVTNEKAKELWVELKRLYEPDSRDPLWALQRYIHDPLVWRLYDTCGVHHVSTRMGH
nr:hypothetical protein [Tanacetum cinerariifolium]